MLGAYFAYSLVITYGVHPLFIFPIAILITAAVGVGIDRLVYFPLRKRKASHLIFLLPSFGVFVFTKNLLQILTFRNGLGNRSSLIPPLKYVREISTFNVHK